MSHEVVWKNIYIYIYIYVYMYILGGEPVFLQVLIVFEVVSRPYMVIEKGVVFW